MSVPRSTSLNRRRFLGVTGGAAAGALITAAGGATDPQTAPSTSAPDAAPRRRLFAVKYNMVAGDAPVVEKFRLLRRLGFDGVEMDSPSGLDAAEVRRASASSGLPIHGVVDAVHWQQRLSDPDLAVRRAGRGALLQAIADAKTYGGSSVLLVPGRVTDPQRENHQQVWDRSIIEIKAVLPLAAQLGVRVLIENVWNGFCYAPDGGSDQDADQLVKYLDAINSPWVGAYLDLGNHRKYGAVERWVRTLGHRIVKLDVKDWGEAKGWSRIGEGDVNWPAVRRALDEIGFTGWCTAEVAGGDEDHLRDVMRRMASVLLEPAHGGSP